MIHSTLFRCHTCNFQQPFDGKNKYASERAALVAGWKAPIWIAEQHRRKNRDNVSKTVTCPKCPFIHVDAKVHVYIDNSGSMYEPGMQEKIWMAMPNYRVNKVFLFTTEIMGPVDYYSPDVGRTYRTGGTDIRAVMEHIKSHPADHIIIITDGYMEEIKELPANVTVKLVS